MTMVHVCQQFTVAPGLGLRPHSRGGCIIVTGFRGCAVKQFHAVNRKCNRPRVSILVSRRQFTRGGNPRTSSGAVAPSFCLKLPSPFSLSAHLSFKAFQRVSNSKEGDQECLSVGPLGLVDVCCGEYSNVCQVDVVQSAMLSHVELSKKLLRSHGWSQQG